MTPTVSDYEDTVKMALRLGEEAGAMGLSLFFQRYRGEEIWAVNRKEGKPAREIFRNIDIHAIDAFLKGYKEARA